SAACSPTSCSASRDTSRSSEGCSAPVRASCSRPPSHASSPPRSVAFPRRGRRGSAEAAENGNRERKHTVREGRACLAERATRCWIRYRARRGETARQRFAKRTVKMSGAGLTPAPRKIRTERACETTRAQQRGNDASVPEMAHAGEDHRQLVLVGGGDDFFVLDGSPGLDDGRRPDLG